jgi:hypothetical protein
VALSLDVFAGLAKGRLDASTATESEGLDEA